MQLSSQSGFFFKTSFAFLTSFFHLILYMMCELYLPYFFIGQTKKGICEQPLWFILDLSIISFATGCKPSTKVSISLVIIHDYSVKTCLNQGTLLWLLDSWKRSDQEVLFVIFDRCLKNTFTYIFKRLSCYEYQMNI